MGTVNTDQLLEERGKTHGEYSEHARATQNILRAMQAERGWPTLSDMQKETVHMIAHKLGRIVTGNPNIADHWDDIAGYSRLISQRLENPIKPMDIETDMYSALAVAWNCTRDEAMARAKAQTTAARQAPQVDTKQGAEGLSPAQQAMLRDAARETALEVAKEISQQPARSDYAKAV